MATETPIFVERNPAVIMAESKAMLEDLLGRALQPAQVEQLMLQFVVYREVLLLERFNAGMAQMLYQFSKAPVLDYIAGLVAVERLPAARAGCTVRFTLVDGHGPVLIPEGTRVSTADGMVIFAITDDIAVPPEVNSVDISAIAETPGKGGNGYAPGKVNVILDPLAFVSTVANLDTTGGGSDAETDEQLRERIRLAPSQYSTAGSRQSYLFHAKSANPLITDISVSSPVPGTVLIVPLTAAGDTPQQVIDDIYRVCSEEDVRPLTDTVIVSAPTPRDYTIEVNLTLYENTDAEAVQSLVTGALSEYAQQKRELLGRDIIKSHIAQVCRVESVYDVAVNAPAVNIIIGDSKFANCAGITVHITGFNRG
ncbi:MAG: baseplate J/gp47 family protein [Prevotellaceae bacterium]|jgi:phage-related baseplate assembly protein|nr:baseplate J/gp47 family protein [Prevotellaceae bacterium]